MLWSVTCLFTALACFTLGFCTQIATIAVAASATLSDNFFGTRTLGTDVLMGLLFTCFLINAGQHYSLDRTLLASQSFPARLLRPLITITGCSSLSELKAAYRCALIFYALLSFAAVLFHLQDPYWREGLTTKSLLTNAYLSKHYEVFRALDAALPWALSIFSITAAIGQTIFQVFMLPLLFCRAGRSFVVAWGSIFFLISLLFINLSYLPYVEIIMWILVFFPAPSSWSIGLTTPTELASPSRATSRFTFGSSARYLKSAMLVIFGLVCGVFVIIDILPAFSSQPRPVWHQRVLPILNDLGFETPYVFNRADLSMGDHWVELYAREDDNWKLVPIQGTDGERLSYLGMDILNFTNHNSDFLYFGCTLLFARIFIEGKKDPMTFFSEPQFGWSSLHKRIRYDYLLRKRVGTVRYLAKIRGNNSSEVRHWKADTERFTPHTIFEAEYDFDLTLGLSTRSRSPLQ